MATRRLSTQPGDQLRDVTEAVGAATATKCVELTFDLANVKQGATKPLTKEDVLLAIERIQHWVEKSNWPPA